VAFHVALEFASPHTLLAQLDSPRAYGLVDNQKPTLTSEVFDTASLIWDRKLAGNARHVSVMSWDRCRSTATSPPLVGWATGGGLLATAIVPWCNRLATTASRETTDGNTTVSRNP